MLDISLVCKFAGQRYAFTVSRVEPGQRALAVLYLRLDMDALAAKLSQTPTDIRFDCVETVDRGERPWRPFNPETLE